jgi:hypothetical protein
MKNSSRTNPRLENFEANKVAYEQARYEQALYGDAGTTDFSDEAKKRIEEADAYERHLESKVERVEEPVDAPQLEVENTNTDDHFDGDGLTSEIGEIQQEADVELDYTSSQKRRLGAALLGIMELYDSRQDEEDTTPLEEFSEAARRDVTEFVTVAADKFDAPRTLADMVLVVDDGEIINKLSSAESRTFPSTNKLLTHEIFSPHYGVKMDGKTFLFSDIFTSPESGYAHSIAYEYKEDGDALRPRLYYRSQSDGGWRATPGINGFRYMKGDESSERPEYGQYVQTTKPDQNIVALLEMIQEKQGDALRLSDSTAATMTDAFAVMNARKEGLYTFPDEVEFFQVETPGLKAYISGVGFEGHPEDARKALENLELPTGFEPDFSADPVQIYTTTHTLAGKVAVEVYPAEYQGREIEWHIARDNNDRLWVDRIEFADGHITSYGTRSEVILAGALSAKPFDYSQQAFGLDIGGSDPDAVVFNDTYVDVTPLLKKMAPLQRYQTAKGL